MHNCLDIPELVRIIFELTEPSDLAALAKTCQAFRDLALQILWADLPSLAPLVRCLPGDVWQEIVLPSLGNRLRMGPFTLARFNSFIFGLRLLICFIFQDLPRIPNQTTDWSRF